MASKPAFSADSIAGFWSGLSLTRRFALVVAALIALAAIIQAAVVLSVTAYVVSKFEGERIGNRIGFASRHVGANIEEFRNVPLVLASTPPIARIADLRAGGETPPEAGDSLEDLRRHVGTLFRSIIELTPCLEQVQFIGIANDGREIVRVERKSDGIDTIPDGDLQRKAERPYFQATIKLQAGDIYMSPAAASSDIAAGQTTTRPTMVAATPIFSSSGRLFGMVVAKASPEVWVRHLAELAGFSDRFMVANHTGAYVHSSEAGQTQTPTKQPVAQLQQDWPDLAPIFDVEGPEALTVRKDNRVVTAARIKFNPSEPKQFIVLAADSDTTAAFGNGWKLILLGVGVGLAMIPLGVAAAYLVSRPLKNLTGAARQIAQGTAPSSTSLMNDPAPEVGELGEALRVMKEAIESRDESLRNSEAHLRAIVDNTIDGLITIDRDGIIRSYNRGCEQIFGYKADEVLGQDVSLLMPDLATGVREKFLERYSRADETGAAGERRDVIGCRKNGKLIDVEVAFAEIVVHGEVLFSGVIRDVTERRQVERLKSEFISTVTHELRTPLTSILGSLALVRNANFGELPEKVRRMIELAYANGGRLSALINNILDIEKIEAGALAFEKSAVPLGDVIRQAVDHISGHAEAEGVHIQVENVPAGVVFDTNRDRLLQVFANLLSNAAKFSPSGGIVTVGATLAGEKVRIHVTDRGRGIPASFRPRVFQKFAQADSSDARQKGGTGLGLSITRAIVERLGGRIDFETEEGVGTTFYFDLPARHAGDVASDMEFSA